MELVECHWQHAQLSSTSAQVTIDEVIPQVFGADMRVISGWLTCYHGREAPVERYLTVSGRYSRRGMVLSSPEVRLLANVDLAWVPRWFSQPRWDTYLGLSLKC